MSGTFIAVVGPSGAGKDTLIRAALASRPDLGVVRRVITRPRDATEDFQSVSDPEFTAMKRQGGFVLDWQAHGLQYGIPATVRGDLASGRHMFANLSRGAIAEARAMFDPMLVLVVTAPEAVLARRLAERGRESADDIAARLRRAAYSSPQGPDVRVIQNGGDLQVALGDLMAVLPQPVSA